MKKALIIVLVSLVVLLPTIVALVLHLLPDGTIQTPITVSGTLFDDGGVSFDFDKATNVLLSTFFRDLKENSSRADLTADQIEYDKIFYANVTDRKQTSSVTLYLSLSGDCYYADEDDAVWKIANEHISPLLNSQFASSIYESKYLPTLYTFSNYVVSPTESSLKFTTADGSFIDAKNVASSGEIKTYYASNTSVITFSRTPYICNVHAYIDGELIFEGTLDTLGGASIPKKATVHYVIDVLWNQAETPECFGEAKYDFYVEYSPIPTFTIDRTSLEAGEFVLIKAENIVDPADIECVFEGGLKTAPRFFKNGDYYYTLIPIDMDLKSGEYEITLTCAESTKKVMLDIEERNRSASSKKYESSISHTQQMFDDMHGLISSIGTTCSDRVFDDVSFINYEIDHPEFTLTLGFGRVRSFEVGPDFNMVGIEFTASLDTEIPAINGGVVCASGVDDILGKYIVIDHGYGLKSWYCNLSEALFSVDDEVKKGDVIAKCGNSAFYGHTGFYFISTVLDIPVSPYAIYEENFTLPN